MDRRRFILSTAAGGAGLAVAGIAAPAALAAAPTDDELAYANFGLGAEFLLKDFYAKTISAKLFQGPEARDLGRGGFNAGEHAVALAKLLTDAGQSAALEEDFTFTWPDDAFKTESSVAKLGVTITQAVLGAYLGGAATISIPSYRTLFASLAGNVAQQLGALTRTTGGRVVGVSFPAALDIQTASSAIEAYLG